MLKLKVTTAPVPKKSGNSSFPALRRLRSWSVSGTKSPSRGATGGEKETEGESEGDEGIVTTNRSHALTNGAT